MNKWLNVGRVSQVLFKVVPYIPFDRLHKNSLVLTTGHLRYIAGKLLTYLNITYYGQTYHHLNIANYKQIV